MIYDKLHTKVDLENGSPAFAKPVLGAVPSVVYNEDCIEGLKRFGDNHFDLAVVDPPYGCIKENTEFKRRGMDVVSWDIRPTDEYFTELFRVSKNQIIWGANYFDLKQPKSVVVWDKKNYSPLYGDGEIAFFYGKLKGMRKTGVNMGGVKFYRCLNKHENKIHPTQKPISLYDFVLKNFANEGDLILDTHLGSGSSRIAAHKARLNFTGFETDKAYYEAQEKRFKDFVSQLRMF